MPNLYKKAVRLAYQKPELRPHLLPLLKKAFSFQSSDLQKALDAQAPGILTVDNFQVSTKPWGYVIDGAVTQGRQSRSEQPEALRDFQRWVMDALHSYSLRLPGEVSVKAKLHRGPSMHFILESKGV